MYGKIIQVDKDEPNTISGVFEVHISPTGDIVTDAAVLEAAIADTLVSEYELDRRSAAAAARDAVNFKVKNPLAVDAADVSLLWDGAAFHWDARAQWEDQEDALDFLKWEFH